MSMETNKALANFFFFFTLNNFQISFEIGAACVEAFYIYLVEQIPIHGRTAPVDCLQTHISHPESLVSLFLANARRHMSIALL